MKKRTQKEKDAAPDPSHYKWLVNPDMFWITSDAC